MESSLLSLPEDEPVLYQTKETLSNIFPRSYNDKTMHPSEPKEQLLRILDDTRKLVDQLLVASEKGDEKVVYAIVHQDLISINCIGLKGYGALHNASSRGHAKIVQLLLEKGAHVEACNEVGINKSLA